MDRAGSKVSGEFDSHISTGFLITDSFISKPRSEGFVIWRGFQRDDPLSGGRSHTSRLVFQTSGVKIPKKPPGSFHNDDITVSGRIT